jgi:hypothetical protein
MFFFVIAEGSAKAYLKVERCRKEIATRGTRCTRKKIGRMEVRMIGW